jgi:hypothetical protein
MEVKVEMPRSTDRVEGLRLRVGVYSRLEDRVVAEKIFGPGSDVTIGGDSTASLIVPGWEGPPLRLLSAGINLHLEPGMRLHMCNDQGENRVLGTFEELAAGGVSFPLRITVSKLNIGVRDGISVFVKYLGDAEST